MIDKIFVCHHKPLIERKEKLQKFFIENDIDVEWVENYLPDEIEYEYKRVVGNINDSEISIYLKHQYCLNEQVKNNFDYTLILEDDVDLPDNFNDYLKNCMNEFVSYQPKLDGLMLGSCCGIHFDNITDDKLIYYKEGQLTRCAHAMIFTLNAAKQITKNLNIINYPIDHKFNYIIKKENLKIGWVEPAIKQKSEIGLFESSIVHTQVTNT
jgi:GR25 family glycosyltransferase involved in LPS biosynthesis